MTASNPDWTKVPEHLRGALQRYLEHGIPPGHFLTAVLSNDLRGAFGSADETSLAAMFEIVLFLYNDVPAFSWGSPERVRDWIVLKSFKPN